jgi:tRNA G10  N-methylase Trm11
MGVEACLVACRWVAHETPCTVVLDPFCGVGTTLACANAVGLDAIGVELSRKRAERAEHLELPTGRR